MLNVPYVVMECMKSLAENGRLVISVIHQPRSSIYEMFDRLLLLSNGRVMYQGVSTGALTHFAAQGYNCPRNFNPSDFYLDILSPDSRSAETEGTTSQRITVLGDAWGVIANEAHNTRGITTITTGTDTGNDNGTGTGTGNDGNTGKTSSSYLKNTEDIKSVQPSGQQVDLQRIRRNFRLLCWRSFAEQSREIPTLMVKMFMTCFFGLIIGGVWSHAGNSQKSINNRLGLLFVIVINQAFNGTLGVVNAFPKEKVIVQR
jgi:hypothetical protein